MFNGKTVFESNPSTPSHNWTTLGHTALREMDRKVFQVFLSFRKPNADRSGHRAGIAELRC